MAVSVLQFAKLAESGRAKAPRVGKLAHGDMVEVTVKRGDGNDLTLPLPAAAASLVQSLLDQLADGARVAVLTEDRELSPNDAARILGISRPLVVHRMDHGDLPFRYVGKHRRALLKDVLVLKATIDKQRAAMEALADDARDLETRYGV